MNISLEKTDDVTGKLIVKIEKSDYEENVVKSLKKMRQKANLPGFRPGNVPMGLIQKMYGAEAKAEEVQKVVSTAINNYIKEHKLNVMGEPLVSKEQGETDLAHEDSFSFIFDLGIAPEFDITLDDKDKVTYYDISVNDKAIDNTIENYRHQTGKYGEVASYEEGDLLRGSLVELDEKGNEKEGGVKLESASLMPKYFTNDEQKALFKDAKPESDVVVNISKAYDGKDTEIAALLKIKKEETAAHAGDFKFHVTTVSRFVPGELNQDLFDHAAGKDTVKSEEEFRAFIKKNLEGEYEKDSDFKFMMDVREYSMKKVGELTLPKDIIKRTLLDGAKTDEEKNRIESSIDEYLKEYAWSLVHSQLTNKLGVKINDDMVMAAAMDNVRMQFAQYGISNIPEDSLKQYAENMLKDENQQNKLIYRAIDTELSKALKKTVKLDHKSISIEDFNKMFEEKKN